MLPPFITGGTTNSPQILNEMSGLYRPTASNADLDRLFATGPLVNAMVTYRADNLALVDWSIKDEAGKTPPGSEAVAALITRDLVRRSEIALCFRGYNLIWKRRNLVSQRIIALRWMNFNMYQPDKHWNGGLQGFRVNANSTSYEPVQVAYIPRADGIYFHFVDLNDDFDGVSPIEAAFMSAGIDVETATTALAFFQNMAIPALLIQPASDARDIATKQDRDDLMSMLRRVAKGVVNAGRTIITPNRWDVQQLQAKFEDLAMTELTQSARESVSMALRVPLPLLLPTEGNFAQTYEARRAWIQTWLIPQAQWYAEQFTEQYVKPLVPDWHVEPDFDKVPGQKEDKARQTEVINAQLQAGYLDLFSAQQALDLPPDDTLKGLYMVQGRPVPREALRTYWQTANATPGGGFGSPAPALAPARLGDSGESQASPRPLKSAEPTDSWLPDAQFKEWRDWRNIVARKGAAYPFEARALPADSVTFGKQLLSAGFDVDEAFVAIKAHVAVGAKSSPPPAEYATPEEYAAYWRDFDTLDRNLGRAWLDYQRLGSADVFEDVVSHQGIGIDLDAAFKPHAEPLIAAWVGTADAPGPLTKLLLAGMAAGNESLKREVTANPHAAKSLSGNIDWSLVNQEALQAALNVEALDKARQHAFDLLTKLNATTRQRIGEAVAKGVEEGWSGDVLRDAIANILVPPGGTISQSILGRAQMIGDNESIYVFNEGAFQRWRDAGVNKAKWRTVNDSLVCPICRELNGQVADLNTGWYSPTTQQYYKNQAHTGCRCPKRPVL